MLHIHRAERADALVEALGRLLADPLADPFAPDVISVPTRGMERWLTQRMSASLGATPGRSDGVCANVEFPFPYRLVGRRRRDRVGRRSRRPIRGRRSAPCGRCSRSSASAWTSRGCAASRSTSAARTTPTGARGASRPSATSPSCSTATRCTGRRWCAAGRAARSTSPPRRPGRRSCGGGCAQRLAEPEPRRAARAGVRAAARRPHARRPPRAPLAVRPHAAARPATSTSCARSPPGATCTSSSSTRRPRCGSKIGERPPVVRRADDATAALADNRLLASWGQDAREMQLVLGTHEHVAHHHPIAARRRHAAHPHPGRRARRPLPAGRPAPGRPRRPAARSRPRDRSIQIHSCHGRARQVEVLRDAILHLLEEDDTLQPRDVIVMCPDIETFAPLIQATFGAGEVVDDDEFEPLPDELRPTDLRVRLADRSLRQTNPVLGVVAQLHRPRRPPPDRLRRARPRRPRARAPALPARGRGPRAHPRLGRRQRHPLGPRRRASRPVQARRT